jgi:hypothetical protein
MPLKRRILKTRKQDIAPHILSYLLCEDNVEKLRKDDAALVGWDYWVLDFPTCSSEAEQIWLGAKEFVIPEWIKRHPGSRPPYWWHFDAPREPKGRWPGCFFDGRSAERKRVGGTGFTQWDNGGAIVPHFERGVPSYWVTESIDSDDPPIFESEATYLKRHGLMTASELRRLRTKDFEPEILDLEKFSTPYRKRKGRE